MKWTLEDEMDWAENVVRERNKEMRRGFDLALEWTFIAIAIWSVVEAARIIVSINT